MRRDLRRVQLVVVLDKLDRDVWLQVIEHRQRLLPLLLRLLVLGQEIDARLPPYLLLIRRKTLGEPPGGRLVERGILGVERVAVLGEHRMDRYRPVVLCVLRRAVDVLNDTRVAGSQGHVLKRDGWVELGGRLPPGARQAPVVRDEEVDVDGRTTGQRWLQVHDLPRVLRRRLAPEKLLERVPHERHPEHARQALQERAALSLFLALAACGRCTSIRSCHVEMKRTRGCRAVEEGIF